MTVPRLAAALAGLLLPVLLASSADAAPVTTHDAARNSGPAHIVTIAERPASTQLVARHYYRHRRHYSRRRHG